MTPKNKIRKKNWSKKILKKNENLGKQELAGTPYHRIKSFCFNLFSSGHKVLCLKIENDPKIKHPKKMVENN